MRLRQAPATALASPYPLSPAEGAARVLYTLKFRVYFRPATGGDKAMGTGSGAAVPAIRGRTLGINACRAEESSSP